MERLAAYSIKLDRSMAFQSRNLTTLGLKLEAEFDYEDAASSLALDGLLLELAAESSRLGDPPEEKATPRWLAQARECIRANFTRDLTLSQICEAINVHPVHLARTFRKHYHCTTAEYVRRLRIELACSMLTASDVNLSEIAAAAGFFDQSHLSNTFKRMTGFTPRQYRKEVCSR